MNWIYAGGDDASGCRRATCQEGNDIYEYYGQWFDDQPSGLGAIRKNGEFYKASSRWVRGVTSNEDELNECEYEKAMNQYQKQFWPHSPHW